MSFPYNLAPWLLVVALVLGIPTLIRIHRELKRIKSRINELEDQLRKGFGLVQGEPDYTRRFAWFPDEIRSSQSKHQFERHSNLTLDWGYYKELKAVAESHARLKNQVQTEYNLICTIVMTWVFGVALNVFLSIY